MRPLREVASSERDHGPHTLRVWSGTVVGTYGDDVFVELGPRMQGVISVREFSAPPAVGDVFEFTLRGQEEGLWALSRREARSLVSWESMEAGSVVQARAVRVAPGGLELKIGPLHAFMPKSHTGLARDERPDVLVGKWLTCEVIEVDAERQRVLLSRKLVLQRERVSEHQREVAHVKLGEIVQGRVTRVEPYGVFIAFGRGLEGLVHVSNIAHERVENPADVLKPGQIVDAKILAVRERGKRIALGIKQVGESPWRDLERRHYPGEIVSGTVTRVVDFGAFVSIERGVEGLLPSSQCGLRPGQSAAAILAAGRCISVRILEFDAERERLTLSLLNAHGARLAADEAENLSVFAERAREGQGAALSSNLSRLLRDALQRKTAP